MRSKKKILRNRTISRRRNYVTKVKKNSKRSQNRGNKRRRKSRKSRRKNKKGGMLTNRLIPKRLAHFRHFVVDVALRYCIPFYHNGKIVILFFKHENSDKKVPIESENTLEFKGLMVLNSSNSLKVVEGIVPDVKQHVMYNFGNPIFKDDKQQTHAAFDFVDDGKCTTRTKSFTPFSRKGAYDILTEEEQSLEAARSTRGSLSKKARGCQLKVRNGDIIADNFTFVSVVCDKKVDYEENQKILLSGPDPKADKKRKDVEGELSVDDERYNEENKEGKQDLHKKIINFINRFFPDNTQSLGSIDKIDDNENPLLIILMKCLNRDKAKIDKALHIAGQMDTSGSKPMYYIHLILKFCLDYLIQTDENYEINPDQGKEGQYEEAYKKAYQKTFPRMIEDLKTRKGSINKEEKYKDYTPQDFLPTCFTTYKFPMLCE